jgi:hypothetical protein
MLPRRAKRSGIFAAALAALLVVGPLLAAAHLAEVQHVTCADHGELLEVGVADGTVALASQRAGQTHIRTLPGEGAGHGHDHCGIAAHRRQSIDPPRNAPAIASPLRLAIHTPPPALAPVAPAQPIHRLAPKNSPPV